MSSVDNLQPRTGRAGPLGHYWFLTFEHAPDLHAAAKDCQQTIDSRFFDPTPVDGLHLTLDRIAHDGASTPEQRASITEAAQRAFEEELPFALTIERLTNLRGAIGFLASPVERIHSLRDTLRAATLSVFADAPVKNSSSAPHVTIAYPMFEGLSVDAAATADRIDVSLDSVAVTISAVTMVALERRGHGYRWDAVARIPLAGG
ncbi:2'-5' RNA ligase family protein [Nocardia lijiangensis]|uniref:2'-5' RNA ligase family protein n=1 Tax=Nocardia lijiangensis TaxID=299618 RepID=UPI00082C71E5|nr:2'-5' RNA ligase family protein [Nocardia lijiangensis]